MFLFASLFFFFFHTHPGSAQTFTVLDLKDGRAIITPSEDLTLELNHTYAVAPSKDSQRVKVLTKWVDPPRQKVLGLSGEISSLFNNKSENTSTYSLSTRYGWNTGNYTFGPEFAISYVKKVATEEVAYSLGGFTDFNFIANRPGTDFVWGMNVHLNFSDTDTYTFLTATNATRQSVILYVGPFAKWFLGHSSTCIRLDLQYYVASTVNVDATSSSQTNGLYTTLGVEAYY